MALALIAFIIIGCTADLIPVNGITTTEIMNRLPMFFTPADYVSVIWFLIYILLVVWLYHFWIYRRDIDKSILNLRTLLFILSSIFYILWIILWHYEFFYWTLFVIAGLLVTLVIMYFSYPKTENNFFTRMPISIYLGSVIIYFISITNYVLILHEWSGWGISHSLWTVIFLTLATAVALHFMYHYRDIAFNIVFMWVFIGIAVYNGLDSLFVTAAALFLTAVIGTSIFFLKKPHKSA